MTKRITLDEALKLVSFHQAADGTWHVQNIEGSVRGYVSGNVGRGVHGNVYCGVGGTVYGTINGTEYRFIGPNQVDKN